MHTNHALSHGGKWGLYVALHWACFCEATRDARAFALAVFAAAFALWGLTGWALFLCVALMALALCAAVALVRACVWARLSGHRVWLAE